MYIPKITIGKERVKALIEQERKELMELVEEIRAEKEAKEAQE